MNEQAKTRAQRRLEERVRDQAQEVSNQLGESFLKFFTTHPDPEGREVADKISQIDRQWRVFCGTMKLSAEAAPHMLNYMQRVVKHYYDMKETKPVEHE